MQRNQFTTMFKHNTPLISNEYSSLISVFCLSKLSNSRETNINIISFLWQFSRAELNSLEHRKFLSYHILLQFYAGFLLLSVYLPLSSSLLLAIAVDWQYINTFLCPACGWLALFSHHLLPRLARLLLGYWLRRCCRRRWRHPQLRCYIRAGQDTASSYTAQHRAMWHKLAHH